MSVGPQVFHSWICGREVEGQSGQRPVLNPATAEPFAAVSILDSSQVAGAVESAREAFPRWSALSFRERGKHLLKLRETILGESETIASLIATEQGKPKAEAHLAEIFPAMETLKHLALHAEDLLREEPVEAQVLLLAHKESRVLYRPLGVVLVITPWNYPFSIPMGGVAAALAAGNTVVLKPAPATTLVGLKIGELAQKARLPEGVLSVVSIDDAGASSLVEDARLAKVVFTGSVATGRRVMASASKNVTPVVLELGGKDAAVVCRDADLDRSARGIVWGAFMNAGQTCASVERVYVEEGVAAPFLERVTRLATALRMGDPKDPETDLGPMTLERQLSIVEDHVADAVSRGARILSGGRRAEGKGFFYPPTVLSGVDHSMRIMREETFGPVLPVMTVKSLDEAIALANDSPYGLTASGWTTSEAVARRLQESLRAGVVTINDCVYSHSEPTAPWGGSGQSGLGRTHGLAGLLEMVQPRYVSRDTARQPMLWWYPYGKDLDAIAVRANQALHSRSLLSRLKGQLALLRFPRFWKRVSFVELLKNADKLF